MPNSNTTVAEGLMPEVRQLRAALRELVYAASLKLWDQHQDGRKMYCSCCGTFSTEQHAPSCTYAAAIAEAERLLGK